MNMKIVFLDIDDGSTIRDGLNFDGYDLTTLQNMFLKDQFISFSEETQGTIIKDSYEIYGLDSEDNVRKIYVKLNKLTNRYAWDFICQS